MARKVLTIVIEWHRILPVNNTLGCEVNHLTEKDREHLERICEGLNDVKDNTGRAFLLGAAIMAQLDHNREDNPEPTP